MNIQMCSFDNIMKIFSELDFKFDEKECMCVFFGILDPIVISMHYSRMSLTYAVL